MKDMQKKNEMLHNTEWQMGKEIIHQKRWSNTQRMSSRSDYIICGTECNYKRYESETTYPLCRTEEDTTEHIMVYQEGSNTYNLLNENKKDWENSCNNKN